MLTLAKSLSKYNGDIFNHWIMAKAEYAIISENTPITYDAVIHKKSNHYAHLIAFTFDEHKNEASELSVFLLHRTPKEITTSNNNYHHGLLWDESSITSFTQDEINDYLHLVSDTNEIHTKEESIVPGLLIFHHVLSHEMSLKNIPSIMIKFISPLHVNEEFCYSISENEILGFTKTNVIFQIALNSEIKL